MDFFFWWGNLARRKTCPIEVRYIASLGPAVIKAENDGKSENFRVFLEIFLWKLSIYRKQFSSFAMLRSKVLTQNMRISVSCLQVTLYSMRDVLCEVDSDLQVHQCSSSS